MIKRFFRWKFCPLKSFSMNFFYWIPNFSSQENLNFRSHIGLSLLLNFYNSHIWSEKYRETERKWINAKKCCIRPHNVGQQCSDSMGIYDWMTYIVALASARYQLGISGSVCRSFVSSRQCRVDTYTKLVVCVFGWEYGGWSSTLGIWGSVLRPLHGQEINCWKFITIHGTKMPAPTERQQNAKRTPTEHEQNAKRIPTVYTTAKV